MTLTREDAESAVQIAHQFAASQLVSQPPIDIESVGRKFGIADIAPREMVDDGYVGRDVGGRLVVRYRSANSAERNRFTIAHEIGHVLISQVTGHDVMETRHRRGSSFEESIANRIAAELLMPEQCLRHYLATMRPSWDSVMTMRSVFQVSTTALVLRLMDIKSVTAIRFRVACPMNDPRKDVEVQASKHRRVLFPRRLEMLCSELIREFERGNPLQVEIHCDGNSTILSCGGRLMQRFDSPAYWFVGWKSDDWR